MPILFDIETISQDKDILLAKLPPWDIEEAKTRVPKNYKKPEAISAWLEQDEANWSKKALDEAALNPETGRIALVGFYVDNEYVPLIGEEKRIVEASLVLVEETGHSVIGWNIHGFDIPFLVKRAWILGIKVPKSVFNPFSRYQISDKILDGMKVWQAGNYKAPYTSLNKALRACGLEEKGNGADFGKLWESDKEAAINYQRKELEQQAKLYERMGLL